MDIKEKIETLEKRDYPVNIYSRIVREFIDDTIEIKPVLIRPGFYLNDISLYKEAVSNINNYDSSITTYCKLIHYIMEKFGVNCNKEKRWKVLLSGEMDEDGIVHPVSINKFIGKNAAMCFERATFLHNTLKILDYESAVIVGNFSTGDDKCDDAHAYNLVVTKNDEYMLLDSTNFMIGVEDFKAYPCIFNVTKDEYFDLIYGRKSFEARKEKNPLKVNFKDIQWFYS